MKNDRLINIITNTIGVKLNKTQLNSATINKSGTFWIEPNFKRMQNDLHLVLINTKIKKLYVFIVPAFHSIYEKLYRREKEQRFHIEFFLNDMNFRERFTYERFDKFLIGECEYFD